MARSNKASTSSVRELMSGEEATREEMRVERAATIDEIASDPDADNEGKEDRIRALGTHIEVSEHRTRLLQSEFDALATGEGFSQLEALYGQQQAYFKRLSEIDAEIAQYQTNINELTKNRSEHTEGHQRISGSIVKQRSTLRNLPGFNEFESTLAAKYTVPGYT